MVVAMTSARLTTSAVAAASGYSVQQVRDLESRGVIAPAVRAANGYRAFAASHVRELSAYRDLARAVGPALARRTMRDLRSLPADEAVALVGDLHARIGTERTQALAARAALLAIEAEAATDAAPVEGDAMTIGELAQALGVRTSTLRYWEQVGLVSPERIATRAGTARRYPLPAIREARITAALRAGGYRIPDVQRAIGAVRELGDVADPLAALDARLAAIADRALALLRAGAVLADLVSTRPGRRSRGRPRGRAR